MKVTNICPTCGAPVLFHLEAKGTVKELYADWINDIEAEGVTAFYTAQIRQRYRDYILPAFGGHRPQDIKTKDLAGFKRLLLRKHRLGTKTAKHVLAALSAFLNHRAESGELDAVPRFPSVKVKATREKHWHSAEAQSRVLNAIAPEDRPIFRVLIETGERVSESCAHQCGDLVDGGIRISRAFDEYGDLKGTKTGSADVRPLSRELYSELMKRCRVSDPATWMFTSDGRPYGRRKLRRRWKAACLRAGVQYVPISQASRHSRASQLRLELERESAERLRDALGHTTARTTLKHYALSADKEVKT